jgi:hypothetical protein
MRIEESEFRIQKKNNNMVIRTSVFSCFAVFRVLNFLSISLDAWNP